MPYGGQCQEFGVYNISRGPDGNYYFATRTGELWKYDGSKWTEFTGEVFAK